MPDSKKETGSKSAVHRIKSVTIPGVGLRHISFASILETTALALVQGIQDRLFFHGFFGANYRNPYKVTSRQGHL
jgi:hypothetical protein